MVQISVVLSQILCRLKVFEEKKTRQNQTGNSSCLVLEAVMYRI